MKVLDNGDVDNGGYLVQVKDGKPQVLSSVPPAS